MLSQSQQEIDNFVEDLVYPLLLNFKSDVKPIIVNRLIRKEYFVFDQSYMDDLVNSSPTLEQNVVMISFTIPTRSYAQANTRI